MDSSTLGRGVACLAVGGVMATCLLVTPAHAAADEIVVTTTDDAGPGSLRAALTEAAASAADDRITFAPSVTGSIQLTSGQLVAEVGGSSGDLTIVGPGAGDLAVDAESQSRVLDVAGSGTDVRPTLAVSGITFTGGLVTDRSDLDGGGAVRAVGVSLLLDRVHVLDSVADTGGGVEVSEGDLVLTDSLVSGNSSDLGGGAFVSGGDLRVIGSSVTHNRVTAGVTHGPGSGGGLYVVAEEGDQTVLALEGSTVSSNVAGARGGGIFASPAVDVTMSDSTIRANSAASVAYYLEAGLTDGHGGGIAAGDLTVTDSTIADNHAALTGGGVLARSLHITGSTVSGNVARREGGGILVAGADATGRVGMTSTTITGNRAERGAGVSVSGTPAAVELTLSTIVGNAAVEGGGLLTGSGATLRGAVVAMNSGGDLAGEGTAVSQRSLVQDPAGLAVEDVGGSTTDEDPLLQPLADRGGATQTMVPAANSPLLDRGSAFGTPTDQRGTPRPVDDPDVADADDGSDIGAVELAAHELSGLPQVASTSRPTIAGVARVGRTLSVDDGGWWPDTSTASYQWLRDGVAIAGATGPTYTITAEDHGRNWYGDDRRRRISVRVSAAAPGHLPGVVESDPTGYVRRGRLTMSGRPRVLGSTEVGATLRARPRAGAVSPRPRHTSIRWHVGGKRLRHVRDERRLELKPGMRGKRVRVVFTYRGDKVTSLRQVVVKRRRVR